MNSSDEARRSTRLRPGWVLAGIVLFLAAFNIVIDWMADVVPEPSDWAVTIVGVWVFEPILLAFWGALGTGPLIIRLSLLLPCLVTLVTVPSIRHHGFQDMERYEFIVLMIAAIAIFAVTTILLLILRWLFGWRIAQYPDGSTSANLRLQFDTKYLIILITICAITLGSTASLKFSEPKPPNFLFGPEFFVHVVVMGASIISLLLLPLIAVPILSLSVCPSKQAFIWSVAQWALVTSVTTAIWTIIDKSSPLAHVLLLQLGAATAGASSALALRLAGLRFVRQKQHDFAFGMGRHDLI